ncbi:MAG: alkaline phosphatase family protein [Lutibacter sp.]|uniref:alkaline phosphatase family protein n=1 Tax=Lutibacter sp. TaxID=1925666 RepID=UPI00299F4693|nr:alkaline phosphatase family protein [Lutibacter sp.]MDX1828672.1 alkaline phosphatase family protein [Lutibacter sp.]
MKNLFLTLSIVLFLFSCKNNDNKNLTTSNLPVVNHSAKSNDLNKLPVYDHIVIVIEENKGYDDIVNNSNAPYINNILKKEGASFTKIYAEEHYSEGNYFWLFSGSNQNVGFFDKIPNYKTPNYPFNTPNLGSELIDKKLSFKGFSEGLPKIGDTINGKFELIGKDSVKVYARKHVPWISFSNVPNGNTYETSSNLRFKDFPKDSSKFKNLPTVSIIVPNQQNDMHNGPLKESIPKGDNWLKTNIDSYYQWAKTHNSLLIVTFDENRDVTNYLGLTNPMVSPDAITTTGVAKDLYRDIENKIFTVFAGAHIKQGEYEERAGITHVNILRTIESMYGLSHAGKQQPNAVGKGITDNYIITDVFKTNKKS